MATSTSHSPKTTSAAKSGTCCMPGSLTLPTDASLAASAAVLKAIAHPVRLKILHVLSKWGAPVCVCDIEAHFELSQPTISHHLRLLRQAGLVEGDQRGPWVYYRIRKGEVAKASREIEALAG